MNLDIRDRRPTAPAVRAYADRRVTAGLARLEGRIQRVVVRLDDANGTRGGIDQLARITVSVAGEPTVVVEQVSATPEAAIDGAVDRVREALKRTHSRVHPRRASARPRTP